MKILIIGGKGTIGKRVSARLSQEMPRGIRLNVMVPGLVADSADKIGHLLPGHNPVPMDRVVNAYVKSIEGGLTGQIFRVFE